MSGSAERADNADELVSEEVLSKAMECADDEAPFYISDEELTQVRKLNFCKRCTRVEGEGKEFYKLC